MKNSILLEAYAALSEVNGMRMPPLISLRIGRNLNSLRPIIAAIEETQKKLVVDHDVAPEKAKDSGYQDRFKEFEKAYRAILDDECEWVSPISIPANMVENAREISNLAQLLAVGIVSE